MAMNVGKMVSELRRMTVADLRRKHAQGAVSDQAEIVRLGHVTRARVTQIMNLLHHAPDL